MHHFFQHGKDLNGEIFRRFLLVTFFLILYWQYLLQFLEFENLTRTHNVDLVNDFLVLLRRVQ